MQLFRATLLLLFVVSSFNVLAKTNKQQLRIIALAPHIVENLYAIGAGEQIVGTVEYADFPAAANKIPRLGGHHGIQIEKLLALKPDLVIAWRSGSKADDIAKIKRMGIDVLFSDAKDINKVPDELLLFGRITAREKAAQKAAEKYRAKLNAIKVKQNKKRTVSVFYQLWAEPMMTVSKNTWINQLIEICHGTNVFANSRTDYPLISIENVIISKPQIIIIPDEKSKTKQKTIDWQQWPEVPAVKYNQFINVNADLLHRFTTRMLDGLEGMCNKIDNSRTVLEDL